MTKEFSPEHDGGQKTTPINITKVTKMDDSKKEAEGGGNKGEGDGVKNRRKRHVSQDSEVSIESIEEYIPSPPDGGWGWVIVFSSMISNLIVDGIGYSFGVFLSEFVETFQASKSKVSLVGSLLCGVYLSAGPIVSGLTNRFGCRPVVIVGSCVATVAFILATFSPNIEMLIVTYGVLGGFGLGMIYLPSIVSVGYYFETKRAFATGIAVCGSGFGTFIFPPLAQFLLSQYTWQGALLIIGGIIFNACICGALMRPLVAKPKKNSENEIKKPRAKNILDRLKETANLRERTVSESSTAVHSVRDTNKILESVMAAKLQREKRLQDNDSDLGSLPSVAFVKRKDSMGTGDHRRFSGNIPIPSDQRKHKLSISSYAESSSSPARDVAGSPGSPVSNNPQIIVEIDRENGNKLESGQVSPDPDSEAKVSELGHQNDGTSTERSDYYTPPVSPGVTTQNSPLKDINKQFVPNGGVTKGEGSLVNSPKKSKQNNGSSNPHSNEFVPLLEVPAPTIRNGGRKTSTQGGSRTNMTHLHSLRSLHISKKDLARPLYRKDIFYSGSVLNIPQFHSQPDMKSYITSITTIPGEMEFVEGPSPSSKCVNKFCSCVPRSVRDVFSEMVDVSLLKDLGFLLICLGNVLAFLGFYIPFVYLVDLAVSLGISKTQAAFLISVIGITNTVGRVAIGKLADLRIIDSLVITYVSIALCGVVTALIPFCTTYPLLAAAACFFGMCVAAFISLSSIVICDLMGLDKLTNAFGLLALVRGIAGMAGPPVAGALYDSSGSYDLPFYMGGFLLLAGASCHIFLHLPCLKRKHGQEMIHEDVIGEDLQNELGSKPQIVTMDDAMTWM